jgi:hypothetical protein
MAILKIINLYEEINAVVWMSTTEIVPESKFSAILLETSRSVVGAYTGRESCPYWNCV